MTKNPELHETTAVTSYLTCELGALADLVPHDTVCVASRAEFEGERPPYHGQPARAQPTPRFKLKLGVDSGGLTRVETTVMRWELESRIHYSGNRGSRIPPGSRTFLFLIKAEGERRPPELILPASNLPGCLFSALEWPVQDWTGGARQRELGW